jgi:cytochrome c oxidase cbb3-type subunit I/II
MSQTAPSASAVPIDRTDPGHPAAPQLDRFSYDDKIVRMFLWATMIWGLVAFLVGLIIASQLPFPKIPGTDIPTNFNLGFLTFARLRPLHTNAAIFAFAGNAIFAAIYYSTQRLCKARMWSDWLSRLHFWGWQLIIVSAALTIPFGITQSKEYAELEWPIDIAIAVVWAGFFGVNFFMTLVKRRERHMYVALWFYIATIVTVAILHIFNNLTVPVISGTMIKSYPIYAGVQDAMMQWWYGHNAVAFFLTTPFLGMMYYFIPKAANRPVFSYRLSIIHFWSLVFIYIWAGPHHLHYSAVPDWASTLGMVFSLMLWMPSWGGMINGLLTLRGAWHKVLTDPILKFFVVAVTFYGMSTFEGPMLSIKSVNSLSHHTDWTIGHVHAGALGWNGFMTFGMMYWLAPRLFQTHLFSRKLAETHFWLATIGILFYVVSMYAAGIMQGLNWRELTPEGQLKYPDFVETTMKIIPMYYIRAVGGAMFLGGALIGAFNLFMTWKSRPATYDVPVIEAAPLSKGYTADTIAPQSDLQGVADFAKKLDVWKSMWWHRQWERMPIKFTVFVIIAVVAASLFEMIPTFVIRSNVPTIASVQPYTPLELAGRDVYIAEGCYNCHSQMIRPILGETKRYGEYSKAGEFVYDHPFQWGSRRIGPDLARQGGKNNAWWHMLHFENPTSFNQGSIMPPYRWLVTQKVDFESIPLRVAAIKSLHPGDKNFDHVPQGNAAVADAKRQAQEIADDIIQTAKANNALTGDRWITPSGKEVDLADKKVVALIAYLQRLGTDLYKPAPEWTQEAEQPATADETHTAPATLGVTGASQ